MKKFLVIVLIGCCGFSYSEESVKTELDTFRATHPLTELSVVRPFASDVMCILLDVEEESDSDWGALTPFLAAAFRDGACPLFVSAPLVKNVLDVDSGKKKKERLEEIEQKLKKKEYSAEETEEELKQEKREIEQQLKKLKRHFFPDQWLCYQSKIKNKPSEFFLFIPKAYTREGYIPPEKTLSAPLEKQYVYGLKLDDLISIDQSNMGDSSFYEKFGKENKDFSENFLEAFSSIFVTKNEWRELMHTMGKDSLPDILSTIPRWAFYVLGHGLQFVDINTHILEVKKLTKEDSKWAYTLKLLEKFKKKHENVLYKDEKQGFIAGIKSHVFKKLLLFCDQEIMTVFLFFDTCYGGGWQFQELLTEEYSYILIASAIAGAVVEGFGEPGQFKVQEFVQKLRAYGVYNYLDVIKPIYLFLDRANRTTPNVPQIKIPGRDFTSIITLPGEAVEIGKVLATTRSPKQPLDVSTFFGGILKKGGAKMKAIYPHAIILHAEEIPFPLVLTAEPLEKEVEKLVLAKNKKQTQRWREKASQRGVGYLFEGGWDFDKREFLESAKFTPKPPAFISKVPFSSWHEFAEIQASDFLLSEMVQAFLPFSSLEENRVFYVKKLIARNDFSTFGEFERGASNSNVYYRLLVINRIVPIVKQSRTRQEGIITKYENNYAVGTVYFEVVSKKRGEDKVGGKMLASNRAEEAESFIPVEDRLSPNQAEQKWQELWKMAGEVTKKNESIFENLNFPGPQKITKPKSYQREMEPLLVETPVDRLTKSLYQLIEGNR